MDGEREDIRIVLKNFCCAVTLMNVKIDHGGATDEAALSQELDGDSNVIEHAKSCAFRTEGMVRSAAQRGSPAVFQSGKSCAYGSANGGKCTVYQDF